MCRAAFLTGDVRVRVANELLPSQDELSLYASWKQFGMVPEDAMQD